MNINKSLTFTESSTFSEFAVKIDGIVEQGSAEFDWTNVTDKQIRWFATKHGNVLVQAEMRKCGSAEHVKWEMQHVIAKMMQRELNIDNSIREKNAKMSDEQLASMGLKRI